MSQTQQAEQSLTENQGTCMATQTPYGKNYGVKLEERTVFTQRELEEAYENHLQPTV